jgi:hypothetical protein
MRQMTLTVEPVREFVDVFKEQKERKREKKQSNKLSIEKKKKKKTLSSIQNKFMITFVILCHDSHQYDEYILYTIDVMLAE